MSDATEFYPMPSFPTLSVTDIGASIDWYRDNVEFLLVFEMSGPTGVPALAHLRWAKYADLLLVPDQSTASVQRGTGITLNFAMGDRSVDKLAESLQAKGVAAAGPIDQPWNARELTVLDPDGYRLTFTQPINRDLPLDDVTKAVGETEG